VIRSPNACALDHIMHNLARAILDTLALLELSSDDEVDRETAIKTMDSIAAALENATEEEREALATVAMDALNKKSAEDAPEEVLDFWEHILADLGLEEPAPEEEA
jgi:hypothetical protein